MKANESKSYQMLNESYQILSRKLITLIPFYSTIVQNYSIYSNDNESHFISFYTCIGQGIRPHLWQRPETLGSKYVCEYGACNLDTDEVGENVKMRNNC